MVICSKFRFWVDRLIIISNIIGNFLNFLIKIKSWLGVWERSIGKGNFVFFFL